MIDRESAFALTLDLIGPLLSEEARAHRFLALSGLSAERLRAEIGSIEVARAIAHFLLGNDADLLAVSAQSGRAPAQLAAELARMIDDRG